MPLPMQEWNSYRGKALGFWLQKEGVKVISNVRFSDERTYDFCCNGIPHNSIIAIGSHGCLKLKKDRDFFVRGLDYIIKVLTPKVIIAYGAAPKYIFDKYKENEIIIKQFDSSFSKSRRN